LLAVAATELGEVAHAGLSSEDTKVPRTSTEMNRRRGCWLHEY
jgi:hypothetical protein